MVGGGLENADKPYKEQNAFSHFLVADLRKSSEAIIIDAREEKSWSFALMGKFKYLREALDGFICGLLMGIGAVRSSNGCGRYVTRRYPSDGYKSGVIMGIMRRNPWRELFQFSVVRQ